MTSLTKERLAEIRAAAEKATPGPWELEEIENRDDRGRFTSYGVSARPAWSPGHPKSVVDTLNSGVMEIITEHDETGSSSWDAQGERDATHIANCDPQTILALLDALDAAEAKMGEPVAWIIPGDDNERADGFIDAMVYQEGEFNRALYAAPPAAEPVIPEGWVLVPREPTGTMMEALEATERSCDSCHGTVFSGWAGYRAMIAAVPALVSEKGAE